MFYWLDLYGADGRPSHHKVLSAWGFFFALGAEVYWGYMLAGAVTEAIASGVAPPAIGWPYVWLVVATLAIPMGKDVFKAVLGVKTNGKGSNTLPAATTTHGQDERV